MDLLRHLRYFVTVADELHFGRAAERLHISQPPLSQRIRALERRVGGPLLHRTSRHVELTGLGRRLLPEAQRLVAHADHLERLLDDLGAVDVLELAIGVPATIPASVVAGLLAGCRVEHPELELDLVQGSPASLEADLRTGKLQMALLLHPLPAGLTTGKTLERPLGVLISESSPLAQADELEVFELAGHELVLPPREDAPAHYDRLLADLRALGYAPPSVRFADGPALTAGLVLAGGTVALTERPPVPDAELAWRPLAGEPLRVRVSVNWPPGAVSSAARRAARVLERLLVEDDGWRPADVATGGPPRPRPASEPLA